MKFYEVRACESNPKWHDYVKRQKDLYRKPGDIRTDFTRDYTRILHCNAYRRLKHKTQVFFATRNDHICTRIEHVAHVSSVSQTIAQYLGLNTELVSAIAIGHDLGHAPFGHAGEKILSGLAVELLNDSFWHERNSLRFVDKCETLPDTNGKEINLNLTYAVRDGIISHCGEVDDTFLKPRDQAIDLKSLTKASENAPFSWEGCVVKVADKIAYLGRDLEDALTLRILTYSQLRELVEIIKKTKNVFGMKEINTTFLMHESIIDLCSSSSPEEGIRFSTPFFDLLKLVKDFSQNNIYNHFRLTTYKEYAGLVIKSICNTYKGFYNGRKTLDELERCAEIYPLTIGVFREWLQKFSDVARESGPSRYENDTLYNLDSEKSYHEAIIDFISGMTDNFAIRVFDELMSF